MKTAISMTDALFARAEAMAKKLGLSRSELYARALDAYLRDLEADDLTERINDVVREIGSDETVLDMPIRRAQQRALGEDEW